MTITDRPVLDHALMLAFCVCFRATCCWARSPVRRVLPPARVGFCGWWLGAIGMRAHLAMMLALRFASAATLAPMQYFDRPFSAIIG